MVSKDDVRRSIKKQRIIARRCRECGHIFVVDRSKMGHDEPDLDPRIDHLRYFHKVPTDRLGDKSATPHFDQKVVLRGEYNGKEVVFFHEMYLTREQVKKLINNLSHWLHLDSNKEH